jgi:transcriptional regulator with XRE-family HTH domain
MIALRPARMTTPGGATAQHKASMAKPKADSIDKHVGTRVQARRLTLGMSQTHIGKALGVTFQQVQKYEKGESRIGAGRLHQLAGILGVPVTFFFEGTAAEASSPPAEDPLVALGTSFVSLKLVAAFSRIPDRELRRRIVRLVEELAGPE